MDKATEKQFNHILNDIERLDTLNFNGVKKLCEKALRLLPIEASADFALRMSVRITYSLRVDHSSTRIIDSIVLAYAVSVVARRLIGKPYSKFAAAADAVKWEVLKGIIVSDLRYFNGFSSQSAKDINYSKPFD